MDGVRLQVVLARAGLGSRRACEQLILEGVVTVNGARVDRLGTRIDPGRDHVKVRGRLVVRPEPHRYLLLNKPRGVVSTASDPEGRPTVLHLLEGVRERVYPVGRLDLQTEGLLLLTNDGELAEGLLHPRTELPRVYRAKVRGTPSAESLRALSHGVRLAGRRTRPIAVTLESTTGNASWLEVTVTEGRQHLVRDALELVGHPVVKLKRIRLGPLRDDELPPGSFRALRPGELAALRRAAKGAASAPAGREAPPAEAARGARRGAKRPASRTRSGGGGGRPRGPRGSEQSPRKRSR